MPLKVVKREIETEREIGHRYLQVLSRAETLVPGAGREAIELLLWDASAAIIRADVQNDRVVLDGALNCQAVYRQGEESSLRALSAKANISQVTEIPGAQAEMLCRTQPVVENVEARYENGHIVFMVSLGLYVRVLQLETIEIIDSLEDAEEIETRYDEICLARLAAEATETSVLTQRVELPQSLDARATLMDWGSVIIDSCKPDLGGVRVTGRAMIETLIASGIEGRPAVLVKYPIEFDKLIELPEWLSRNACVNPAIRSIRTQLEPPSDEEEEGTLLIQADVNFAITANLRECVNALTDAYSTGGRLLDVQRRQLKVCADAQCLRFSDTVRGTVLLEEGAPAAGSVIAVRVQPTIAEIAPRQDGSRISGLLEAMVLYMPGGSDRAVSARTQMPFETDVPAVLEEGAAVRLEVTSAEANALMSDRLEMKIGLNVEGETRSMRDYTIVTALEAGEAAARRPGYIICWPEIGEDAWAIGRKYGVALADVSEAAGGAVQPGHPLVVRI